MIVRRSSCCLSTDCACSAIKSVEEIVKKLLIAAVAGLLMAACSEAPTAPAAPKTSARDKSSADLECRSGYMVAYDQNGTPYCAPADGFQARQAPKP